MPPAFSDRTKNPRAVGCVLEPLHHVGRARSSATPPCRNSTSVRKRFLQVPLQQSAHLGELGEDQRPIALRQHLLEHLGQPRELARAALDRELSLEELRRVVADLLQLR